MPRRADTLRSAAFAAVLLAAAGSVVVGAQSASEFVPVTDAMLQDPPPEDWLMWRRTLDSWGFSPLDQIDRDNVAGLRLVWTRPLGPGLQQGTPLVYDGVLYMPNPRDIIQALDAVSGDLIWEHRRERPDDLADYSIGSLIDTNRNIAIHGNYLFDSTSDAWMIAIDARTGEVAWETMVLDYTVNPANQTSGPIVADGKVISGRSCSPKGGPKRLRHRRARRGDRRGAVAAAPHTRPGRVRRRDLGRRSVRGTEARRRVDGPELRPRAEPRLHRHVGHVRRRRSS